eukprot:m.93748 g.93748  ORF g.93748 m.93748 type:complete len:68 (-) comp14989_c0_seq27:359-562(-)
MPAQDIHPRHVRNRLENDSCRASVCLGDGGAAETGRSVMCLARTLVDCAVCLILMPCQSACLLACIC